jgi:amino acid adenylation domain-containing protein
MGSESYIFPASFAQQRLWFLDQLDPGKSVYNMLYAVRLNTRLNVDALHQSLNEIVQRHESLRTTFAADKGQPIQVIAAALQLELPIIDLRRLARTEREAETLRRAQQEGEAPFDLATGPLLRTKLLLLDEDEHVLLITVHHIVSDGWSMGVFLRELATLYEASSEGRSSALQELPIQYADYAVWQREWLQADVLDAQVAYWREQLNGAPLALELATDRPRPALQTFAGARRHAELPASLTDRLRTLSRREGVTLFMTLLAAFEVLLWRYSGQDDLIVGTPIAGRNRSELEGLIGYFANTLPLRVDVSGNPTFRDLLSRVRETSLNGYAHQDVPFDKLVEELRPERSLSHTPLFQVIFALENTPHTYQLAGLDASWLEIDRGTARCDLSLFVDDKGSELGCMWEYSTDLFDGETIERMISNYRMILEDVLENPEQRIAYLNVPNEAERQRLIQEWNSNASAPTAPACMQQLFEAQAAKTPDQLALVFREQRLTFQELNTRANQLAHHLQKLGVGPEVPVGVYLERSAKMITALLGILKAGGAYVPIDPGYPAGRLAFMLEDSRVRVLLTETRLLNSLPALAAKTICLDDWTQFANETAINPVSEVTPENLAYVIYTSGSTGRPKGVEVTHRSVVHLFQSTRDQLGFRAGDIYTVVHSSAFDFSVWEIWGSLLQGGQLVVVPLEVVQSAADFYDLLCRERVTVLNQTPSALRALLDVKQRAQEEWSVRLIVCGGDALDSELAAQLPQMDIPVWNFYGPTESTVWATCNRVPRTQEGDTSIGRPLPDIQVYLLDDYLQPVPIGVPGELFIGGAGLARGYLNRPELTAQKFIPNQLSQGSGARLYRTGDLARYRADGKIEFLGRIDHQIKLRGFRVELGEIEAALTQHEAVAQAVVVLREDRRHDQRLVAYIVADGDAPTASELRRFLQSSLPDYMVPSAFVILDAMPLTPNRKVDRRALPAPDYSAPETSEGARAPESPVAGILTAIWTKVLGVEHISIDANFFAAGGHSLLATQVMSRIRDAFQIELPLRVLFESPSISELSERIERAIQAQQGLLSPPLLPVNRDSILPVSFAQQRLWFLDQLEPNSSFYNISRARRLRGNLNVSALSQTITEIVRRHEALRTSFWSEAGTPYQRINECESVPLPVIDISAVRDREHEVERRATEETARPFDLSRGPLLRASLLRLSADDHVLVLTLHHIAADGWSLAVLFDELTRIYEAFASGKPSPLPALPIQYADYAVWQRQWLQGETLEKLVAYWKKQFAGAPAALELPTDKPRPALQTFGGAIEAVTLPVELHKALKALSRTEGTTLFMTCLAAFQLLLSRWSGQRDLIVGTDVANRGRVETEDLIGFFTNLLSLRAKLSDSLKFTELLRQVRETTLEAYAHQDLPFEKLVEELRPPRDLGRNPLVQVLLVMQNEPSRELELPGLKISRFALPVESSRFDLVLFLSESEAGLEGMWLYNSDLFEPATIGRLSLQYKELLESVVRDPEAPLDSYKIARAEQTSSKRMEKKVPPTHVNRLRSMRRKGVDLSQLSGVRTGALQAGQTLPLVLEPDAVDVDLAEWAGSNRHFIDRHLLKHGAILFRGFPINSVVEFEEFACAICPELFGEYGDLPREQQGGKVYGSTPYPADETILFHNESSHMHRWPMLIWFYCVKAAEQGGESPILDCRRIYQLMEPSLRERFEQKGLMYVRNFTEGLDVSWQKFFHTNDRSAAEKYCREAGIDFEWKGENGLRTRQLCPAVVRHPQTGELVFFNQLQLHHVASLAPAVRQSLLSMTREEDLPRHVYYGDASAIEDSVMQYLDELYRANAVSFPWQERDVLMLNNMLVAHSRNPFVGERKIVVALGNLVSKEQIEQPALVNQ